MDEKKQEESLLNTFRELDKEDRYKGIHRRAQNKENSAVLLGRTFQRAGGRQGR